MKLVKLGFFCRLNFFLFDIVWAGKSVIKSYLYPQQISDYMKEKFDMAGIHNTMIKAAHDNNWYTNDPNSKFGLLKADKELAAILDACVTKVSAV